MRGAIAGWMVLCSAVFLATGSLAVAQAGNGGGWRAASEAELRQWVPARAQVEKERIETEFRTASGIVDGKGKYVVGVVLITAGYSADGKYSNSVITQVPLKIAGMRLDPGQYVFGWQRESDALQVKFYEAASGKYLGSVTAGRDGSRARIESFRILPPGDKSVMMIGRFAFPYEVVR